MSEFDFLARIPLGQYVSTGSIMHRLDPRAKIFYFPCPHPCAYLQSIPDRVGNWSRFSNLADHFFRRSI